MAKKKSRPKRKELYPGLDRVLSDSLKATVAIGVTSAVLKAVKK